MPRDRSTPLAAHERPLYNRVEPALSTRKGPVMLPMPPPPPPPYPQCHLYPQSAPVQVPIRGWLVAVPPPAIELPPADAVGPETGFPPLESAHKLLALAAEAEEPRTTSHYAPRLPAWQRGQVQADNAFVRASNPWALPDPLPAMQSTFVGELRHLAKNKKPDWNDLKPQTRSDLGFDGFLYQMRGSFEPSHEQLERMLLALMELACKTPEDLWRAVFYEQLRELLGPGFCWAAFPKVKTIGGSPSSW